MPAVSVIMPAYNVGPYIVEAIESAIAQTFADIEILVIDDGSTDETCALASDIAAGDPRVRLIWQPNSGVSSARNRGLAQATGELIALLDGDDVWDPRYLEEQLAILQARPAVAIVTGNAWLLGGSRDGHLVRPCPDLRPALDLSSILADEGAVFIMSVFRRSVYDSIGGFDESLRTNEDYDYWIRAAAAGFGFARNDRPLGRYRRRNGSLSASEERMLRGILRVYQKTAPLVADRPREREIIERQIESFEWQLLRAEARSALEMSDLPRAAALLDALHERRFAISIAVARFMAHWTPGLLSYAYQFRRHRQLEATARAQRLI